MYTRPSKTHSGDAYLNKSIRDPSEQNPSIYSKNSTIQ